MSQKYSQNNFGRRRFLLGAWGAALAVMLGEGVTVLFKLSQPIKGEGEFGGIVRAGRVEEFEISSISYVRAGRFYLVRLDEGFLALWQTCTHLGCSVPWVEEDRQFECPCHGSIFTEHGEVVSGPAPRPLDFFKVEIVSGEVFVDTSKPLERKKFDLSQVTRV